MPDSTEPRFSFKKYLLLLFVALLFSATGFMVILAKAGIVFFDAPDWFPAIRIARIPNADHQQVIAAALTWLSGTIALIAYFLNRDHKVLSDLRHAQSQHEAKETVDEVEAEKWPDLESRQSTSVLIRYSLSHDNPENGETTVKHIRWGAVALIIAITGVILLIPFAGLYLFSFQRHWPLLDPTLRPAVLAAAFGWVGFVLTWFRQVLMRDRQIIHEQKQLEIQLRAEEQRRHQDRVREEEKERRARDDIEFQRTKEYYLRIVSDFNSDSKQAQSDAVTALGEIARFWDLRYAEYGKVSEDPREDVDPDHWKTEWRTTKTERNYPYFMPVARRLATALYIQNEETTRRRALTVLYEMASFAKHEGTYEPLLQNLASVIADANRTAWQLLKDGVRDCLAEGIEMQRLKGFLRLEPSSDDIMLQITDDANAQESFMRDLFENIKRPLGKASNLTKAGRILEPQQQLEKRLFDSLHVTASGVFATRDALAGVMQLRSAPPDAPVQPRPPEPYPAIGTPERAELHSRWEAYLDMLEGFQDRCQLNLDEVRMYAGDFSGANFSGAKCRNAFFDKTNCFMANFQGSDCYMSSFQDAVLMNANVSSANFTRAAFTGANCSEALFEGATCFGACFKGSDLRSALFQGSNCQDADFSRADCRNANFDWSECNMARFNSANCLRASFLDAGFQRASFTGANCSYAIFDKTRLFGAQMGQSGDNMTLADGVEWAHADFYRYDWNADDKQWRKSEEVDTTLQKFLKAKSEEKQSKPQTDSHEDKGEPGDGDDIGSNEEP